MSIKKEYMDKFSIIKTLDDWRWKQLTNQGGAADELYRFEIETYPFYQEYIAEKDKLTVDLAKKILLAHYLVYICDRQMDYRFIFRYGGYVIAKILEDYIKDFGFESPKDDNKFSQFIKDHITVVEKTAKKADKESKFSFYLKAEINENTKLYKDFKNKNNYLEEENKTFALFASRMTLIDYCCLFRTLKNINKFFDLAECQTVGGLAEHFFECTYKGAKRISGEGIKNTDELLKLINNKINEAETSNAKFESKKFKSKRLWCIVRDYLYNPLFKKCFGVVIGNPEPNYPLYEIELPGDVWNNNSTFADCFWGEQEKDSNSSYFVREQFKTDLEKYKDQHPNEENCEEKVWKGCIPIQFDVTFNFVPRMCSINNCFMCPLAEFSDFPDSNIKEQAEKWKERICHKKEGQYCTLALYTAGIKYICTGSCELAESSKELPVQN